MGNSASNPVKNMDKRTARREFGHSFQAAIAEYRSNRSSAIIKDESSRQLAGGDVKVCVRKRPIFQYELESSEFDVITCCTNTSVTIHGTQKAIFYQPDCTLTLFPSIITSQRMQNALRYGSYVYEQQ